MKSENLLTPAELNALLTPEEREHLQAEYVSVDASAGDEHTGYEQAIVQLLEAVSSLTLRVEALEHQLEQRAVKMEHAAAITTLSLADTPSVPEPGSFSRSESYGRNGKKKKSLIQKLLD
jgi:phage shock protein A